MANLSELEVELAIHERDIGKIKPGQRCKVRTEAFPDRIYDGVVSRVMPVANRLQSAIPIRVKITVPQEEEGVYLKPEMIAVVSFLGEAAIARLDEAEKASQHSSLQKQVQPAPSAHVPSLSSGQRLKVIAVKTREHEPRKWSGCVRPRRTCRYY